MNAKEWLIVLSAGAAGPAAVLGTATTFGAPVVVGAVLSFFIGAGAAAKAMHMPSVQQRKKDARGQAEDDEDPR